MYIYLIAFIISLSSSAFAGEYENVDCLDLIKDEEKYQECLHDEDSFNIDGIGKSIENFFKKLSSPDTEE